MNKEVIILSIGLIGVIAVMVVQLLKIRPVSTRKWVLNMLFWLSLVILFLPLKWNFGKKNNLILIYDNTVSSKFKSHLADSLGVDYQISIDKIKGNKNSNPTKDYDEVVLCGTDFDPAFLASISGKKVSYFPFFEDKKITDLNWNGILHQFENQEINGSFISENTGVIKAKYGNFTIDSVSIPIGGGRFTLNFPAFGLGRNQISLFFEDSKVGEVNFFTQKTSPLSVKVMAENPDFELKTLAEWLGKQGHKVEMVSKVSKNDISVLEINKAKVQNADLVITTPENLQNAEIKKVRNSKGGILIVNLQNVGGDVNKINSIFSEKFKIKRLINDQEIALKDGSYQHPFVFENSKFYKLNKAFNVASSADNLAVSVYSETYPLILSGDSLNYGKIWAGVINSVLPPQKDNFTLASPLLKEIGTELKLNNLSQSINQESKSIHFDPDGLGNYTSNLVLNDSGWQKLNDSLEVFSEISNEPYLKNKIVHDFLNNQKSETDTVLKPETFGEINIWWKWALVILFFTLLWLEPKF